MASVFLVTLRYYHVSEQLPPGLEDEPEPTSASVSRRSRRAGSGAPPLGQQLPSQRPPLLHWQRALVLGDDLHADMIRPASKWARIRQVTRSMSPQATISSCGVHKVRWLIWSPDVVRLSGEAGLVAALIFVEQAAQASAAHDLAPPERWTGAARRLETQRAMGPGAVVMVNVFVQDPLEVVAVDDQEPVETFPSC